MDDLRKDYFDPKIHHPKNTAPNNYKPIAFLPSMWKKQIKEAIYDSLISCRTDKQLQVELRYSKATPHWSTHLRKENVALKSSYGVNWLQNAYDILLQSLIIDFPKCTEKS